MIRNHPTFFAILFSLLFIGVFSISFYFIQKIPSKYDDFAKCLGEKGAEFYGAFWCPHCQGQKAMFGRAEKYLPYIECSTPDAKAQLQICRDKGVKAYPTWIFADGSAMVPAEGQNDGISLTELAQKTACVLPK